MKRTPSVTLDTLQSSVSPAAASSSVLMVPAMSICGFMPSPAAWEA